MGIQKLKDHPRAEASSKYKNPSIFFFYVQHKQLFHGKKTKQNLHKNKTVSKERSSPLGSWAFPFLETHR